MPFRHSSLPNSTAPGLTERQSEGRSYAGSIAWKTLRKVTWYGAQRSCWQTFQPGCFEAIEGQLTVLPSLYGSQAETRTEHD
jgi:hypothetical protein